MNVFLSKPEDVGDVTPVAEDDPKVFNRFVPPLLPLPPPPPPPPRDIAEADAAMEDAEFVC